MNGHNMKSVEHRITVEAPAPTVYALLADVSRWPVCFRPTVYVDRPESGPGTEQLRIWAVAGDTVKAWTSRRELFPRELRITFRQEVSQPPIASMDGSWTVRPSGENRCEVVLGHRFRAVGDDPAALSWIDEVTDRNSTAELAALAEVARDPAGHAAASLTFDDTVTVDARAEEVHGFLYDAARWPERLPHVGRMELSEPSEGVQIMEMDTVTADGSAHTTKSVRVCPDARRIVYKQVVVPPLLRAHTGEWILAPDGDRLSVTSRHTVVIRPEAVEDVLGPGQDLAAARAYVRTALGTNSRVTLEHAKAFAEGRAAGAV
ncbi:aromatase/cyclase [Streptomyces sp. NPDC014733]|uniref:aromatase/cyclase n=1 Tax=Streptomyces sp. NPDC014733 TaxID=3364885 RepID=UPI003702C5FF